jgi:predicted dehydrogenase
MNRRQFLAATAAAYATTQFASAADKKQEKIPAALIGCGGFGNNHLRAAYKNGGVEFLAICDVDSRHLKETAAFVKEKQGNEPKTYHDYRELLDHPGIKAVFIATPPQWHALPFIAACEKGYDIYCEKPMAYDIREQQAMIKASEKAGNVVQIGFQRRESDILTGVRDYIQSGKAGKPIQINAHINYKAPRESRKHQAPPEALDWDFWCGPAPRLPYSPAVGHYVWRLEETTGNGHLVDWGIHMIDEARKIIDESMPHTISASGGIYDMQEHITTPDVLTASWEYETCPMFWQHRIWGAAEHHPEDWLGVTIFGEDQTIFLTDKDWTIIPRNKDKEPKTIKGEDYEKLLPQHVGNFVQAVRDRGRTSCPPHDGYQSTAAVQLAMIAYNCGEQIAWDNKTQSIPGNPAAQEMLKREYRSPWKHPWESSQKP